MVFSRAMRHAHWALAGWAMLAGHGCTPEQSVSPERSGPQATAVKLVAVSEQEVRRTSLQPATVHPFYRTEIRAKASGFVESVSADIGDVVKAGATLAVIKVPELNKQREILQARITRSDAEEQRAKAGVTLAEANVKAAQARLAQAESETKQADAALAAAEAEFTRTEDLVERQSLQSRMLDEVRSQRDSAIASRDALVSAVASASAQVTVAEAQRTSAQADQKVAEAETAIARRQLEELDVLIGYATLKAPFAGLITRRTVDPGDLVREASEVGKGEPLFVLSQVDKVRVHILVPEVDAAVIERGAPVQLSFPSFSGEETLTAAVTRVSGDLDPSTRTMLVEVELPNPQNKLLPGMFGQATIELSSKVAANTLPARAIRFSESGEAYVYAVSDDKTVSVVNITTGTDDGQMIEVLTGLEPGQRVIDAHLKRFTNGQSVTVLNDG